MSTPKAFKSGQYTTGTQLLAIIPSSSNFKCHKLYTVEQDLEGQYILSDDLKRKRITVTTFLKAVEVPADSEFAVSHTSSSLWDLQGSLAGCAQAIPPMPPPIKPMVLHEDTSRGDQVGGNHYGEGRDVFDFSLERDHDCLQHSAIKYIDRHKLKNGKEDIRKAISVLERIILEQYK